MLSQFRILSRLLGSSFSKYPFSSNSANISTAAIRNSSSTHKVKELQDAAGSSVADGKSGPAGAGENELAGASHNLSDSDQTIEVVQEKGSNARSRRDALKELEDNFVPFRYVYPEFLPEPNLRYRNRVKEKLERVDMLNRRRNIDIPEFYVGSILSVTTSDPNAPGKASTFVGICTERDGQGLRSSFILRNVVDGLGVEMYYDLYNPTIQNITCLRLEKRLDDNLRYLRDTDPEHSTFPFDMVPEMRSADTPVPINPIKVKLKDGQWSAKWQMWDLKGIEDISGLIASDAYKTKKLNRWKAGVGYDVKDYDLIKTYRTTIPVEDQVEIYSEYAPQLSNLSQSMKKQKRKRTFTKPQKTA